MQTCIYCGAELPKNSRFCGTCGHVQDAFATDASATRITPPPSGVPDGGTLLATQPPYSNAPAQGSTPYRSAYPQPPTTPLPSPNQNENERRSGIPPWSPFAGAALGGEALLGSGQIAPPGAPVVQGTPQLGNVPSVPGSPSAAPNAPFIHPTLGVGNASPVHPMQGPGNIPVSHPAQGPVYTPVSHPPHGPSAPHPQPGPYPIHHPPEPPEIGHHHPIRKRHRDNDHDEDKHHHHHEQHAHHVAHASKVAGVSSVKTILIVIIAAAVVAAGGVAAAMHFLASPQPLTGANGVPLDGASFTLNITVQATNPDIADPFALNPVLIITGHPEGGSVCSPDDNGQSFTRNSVGYNGGPPYILITTASCSGVYKAGRISYNETDVTAKGIWQSNGQTITCVLNNPTVDLQMTGTYVGNNTFSGTFNSPYIPYSCDQQGYSFYQVAIQGTWTARITDLHS